MAIQKTIIKNDRQKAVVHIVGAAGDSTAIALTDLLNADETSSTSNVLKVAIASVYCNAQDATTSINITRGGSSVLTMFGVSDYPSSNMLPALEIQNTTGILVTFNVPGTIVLDLRKNSGFIPPNTNVGV